jgi:ataxia telangiectasia mutated family protein
LYANINESNEHNELGSGIDTLATRITDARRGQILSVLLYCQLAREGRERQRALAGTVRLKALPEAPLRVSEGVFKQIASRIEEASAAWELNGASSIAINMLRTSAQEKEFCRKNKYYSPSEVIARIGYWSHKARNLYPDSILSDYMKKAVLYLETQENAGKSVESRVYHMFAEFCDDTGYDVLRKERIEHLEIHNSAREEEIKHLTQLTRSSRTKEGREEAMRHLSKVIRVLKQDSDELSRLKAEQASVIRMSLEYYIKSVSASEEFPQDVGRFVAIWLEFSEQEPVIGNMANYIQTLPSHKVVEWAPQLISRLVTCQSLKGKFAKQLFDFVVRLCADHPFQTIYTVINHQVVPRDADEHNYKARIAVEIAKQVRNRCAGDIIKKTTSFAERIVALSGLSVKGKNTFNFDSSKVDRAWWIKALPTLNLPPPVMTIPIRPDHDYASVCTIVGVKREIVIASGLSAPKVVTLRLSDGTLFKMLIKGGNDDLRQDQIMEHMFGQVNSFFQRHKGTRQRNLKVRTYNVQPLGPACGIIEFVSNTKSLMEILSSVHDDKLSITKAKEMMRSIQQESHARRLEGYYEITRDIRPSLRHFFWFHACDTRTWLTMRTAYSRSTAAISIVGHVIGLGDRHCSNIIVDITSGEVIHIDLGIAFDQGKLLRIPETVPFRLTRDIVDGMGITGTEGVFQRCCEFTLSVLREEANYLMTSLNVLKYDPLYSW